MADDLQEPDESRPAKRVRLEGSLGTTEDIEEEIVDDEDLYGTDGEEDGGVAILGEPNLKPAVGDDPMHELPSDIKMSEGGVQVAIDGKTTPKIDGDDAVDTEDFYSEGKRETVDGLPADAVDRDGDDLVAPPQHVSGPDGIEEAMMEETSRVEAEPPVEVVPSLHGEPIASTNATEQLSGTTSPAEAINMSAAADDAEHIAPERSRPADKSVVVPPETSAVHEEDFYGGLEAALQTSTTGSAVSDDATETAPTKPKNDAEFLEAAAVQKGDGSAEWQFDSADAESSSTDSSDSSDSDSDSDTGSEGGYEMLDPATAAKILMAGDGEDGGEKETKDNSGGPRTTNEVKDNVVHKPNVEVTEDMKITLLGAVDRIVGNMALIKGATPGEYQVLESGSVLCSASREVLGAVAETFGRVQEPMYSVAFNNAKEIEDKGLTFGTQVYYVDKHSEFVFTQPLKGMKGTDASNIHDEEVGPDEVEFSDDEKEAEYKRLKKAAKRGGRGGLTRTDFNSNRGGMHSFGAPGHDSGETFVRSGASDAPETTYGGGMSYDDDDEAEDEFYKPLKRPDNISELMTGRPPPPPAQRGGFDRGRGRGRGKGDRGRGDRGRGRGGFNQRGQRGGGFGGENARGGQEQSTSHKGSAHSFPDHHNNGARSRGRGPHQLPPKPHNQQSPTPPQSSPQQQHQQYPPFPQAQPQHHTQVAPNPQTYQFNGYTFQYGNPPPVLPAQYQQPSPQQQQYYQNYQHSANIQQASPTQQQSHGAQFPAGAYVNPAFWAGQQQQHQQHQQPAQQYRGWAGQAQQYVQPQAYAQGEGQGPPGDLANILRALGGQGQNQGR